MEVAFKTPRAIRARIPRAERVADDDGREETQPIRTAYLVSRPTSNAAPRAQAREDYEQDQDLEQDEESGRIERRGDQPTVAGSRAVLRNGVAYAPSRAPQSVKNAIWAANSLRRKPYVWGGGHGSFYDRGYDCSGTVSFALHGAGALAAPLPSSDFTRYGERGRGRWITVYARPGHTFAMIAGLRLDTTDFRRGGDVGPRWYTDGRDARGFDARHPAGM
jgi:cell wall-associated NlpC family hydrolase